MIQIIQDNTTAVKLGNSADAYIFPNGTVFTGFLRITEESSGLLNSSIEWFINGATAPTYGLNLPYGVGVPIINGTVEAPGNRAEYNAALIINTNLVVANITELFSTLDGKIEVTGI